MANRIGTDNPETLRGTDDNDVIQGLGGDDKLYGLGGIDILDGGDGNDWLDAGTGANDGIFGEALYGGNGDDTLLGDGITFMEGGAGNDVYYVDLAVDTVVEEDGQGIDVVVSSVSYTMSFGVEHLYLDPNAGAIDGIGNGSDNEIFGNAANNVLSGRDGNDALRGGDGNDTLHGENGDDYLDGGGGNDYLDGGIGNDTYWVDSVYDTVVEAASAGNDTVYANLHYALTANVENLVLDGINAINGGGNDLDNHINGNNANNTITAGSGNDTVYGFGGSDTIFGGAGNDGFNGGDGNDTLYGDSGNDHLNGGAGADRLEGGTGNDIYWIDSASDVIVEATSAGTDLVYAAISYTLAANVENLALDGNAAINGTGNSLKNTLYGNVANNTLSGGANNDILLGDVGDDTLNGGTGNDILMGGNGSDVLTGGSGADMFKYEQRSDSLDVIKDFKRSEGDKIQIVKSTFGATSLTQFSYNSSTGALFFNGMTGGPLLVATIANKPTGFSVQSDVVLV